MMDAINIENLSKSFGTHRVLDSLDMAVPAGSIFGLVGENGAGKTTIMKIILGLLAGDGGSIRIFGEDISASSTTIGYLPDVPSFYGYMNAIEYMTLCGKIGGIEAGKLKSRTTELLDLVGIGNVKTRISNYSRGMNQRLGIAQALIAEPDILICDEPTSALDPSGRRDILDIIRDQGGETTVIFSTHILTDVERICDQVALLHHGRIVMSGSIEELERSHRSNEIILEFGSAGDRTRFVAALESLDRPYRQDRSSVVVAGDKTGSVIDILHDAGLMPLRMDVVEPDLEKLFMEMVE